MSIVSSQTIKTTDLYNKVNEGVWKIVAILGITSTGTVLVVAFKDGSQLIVIVSDLASTGSSSILDGSGTGTLATVDATPKALRTALYDQLGNAVGVDPQKNLDVSINTSSTGAIVATAKPTSTARGVTVRLVTGETIQIGSTAVITAGQATMGAAAAQFTGVAVANNNAVFINLDAVNAVDIGPSTVTVGTGARLAKAGDPASVLTFRNITPSAFWGIAVAGAPVVSFAFI